MRKSSRWFITIGVAIVVGAIAVPQYCASRGSFGGTIPQHATVKPFNLPPTLPIATGYTAQDYFASSGGTAQGFDQSICTAFPPGEKDRLFVVSKTGTIDVFSGLAPGPDGKSPGVRHSTFMDINPYLRSKNLELGQQKEWGILGLAFHPKFKENGQFFITYDFIDREGFAFDRLARFTVSKSNPNAADMTSEVPLITQRDMTPNHNGGCLQFNDADGYLYYSMGDDGYPRDQQDRARYVDRDFFAAIYRIDVDRKPDNLEPNPHTQQSTLYPSAVDKDATGKAHYKIPRDNPLVGDDPKVGITKYMGQPVDPKKVRTEIYAHGVRNPWRFSIDPVTGRIFEADVGEDTWEEINIIGKGGDYGWPYREALIPGPRSGLTPPAANFIDPIFTYQHGGGKNCITGGFVYRGSRMPELYGAYIFADYSSGEVGAIREKDGKWGPAQTLLSGMSTIVNIAPDPVNGDVLFTTIGRGAGGDNPPPPSLNGHVYRLIRAGTTGTPPPAKLSQVGAFKDLANLTPADGLIPYEPNVTFWSDYALKQRWFIIPNGSDTIKFNVTGNWTFPTGMVWVKHFEMEMTRGDSSTRRRLETRFLFKTADGVYGITYKWCADNSDADLVKDTGEDEVLTIKDGGTTKKQTWHYPSQAECLICHTSQAGGALAFNTWQMNGNGKLGSNQIEALAHAGYFDAGTNIPDVKSLGAYAKADDTSATLEWRVRSYLGANCVQCHQPGGGAQGSWDARPFTKFDAAGIVNGVLNNNRGDATNKVVMPGDLTHSMIFKRLEAKDAPRMPPLASNEIDPSAQKLIRDWITTLKK